MGQKKPLELCVKALAVFNNGRGDRIRTCDICVPNAALYQAELLPELLCLAAKRKIHDLLSSASISFKIHHFNSDNKKMVAKITAMYPSITHYLQ